MKFFKATYLLKELKLLQYIENNSKCTQKELAKTTSSAVSMINTYINELEEKNYLKREYISAKIVYYLITDEGIKRKNYLFEEYKKELDEICMLRNNL